MFSEVTLRRKDSEDIVLYESGRPDEYDIRALLKSEDRYAAVRSSGLDSVSVQVQHYRFLEGSTSDWLAEQEHIARIETYDEMTPDELFTQRDDVECLEFSEFFI